jgi:FkbM family methyltransferase
MRFASRLVEVFREEPRPWRFLVSRILVAARLSALLKVRRRGYRLYFSPSSVGAALWMDPEAFRGEESFITGRVPPGGTYVDVGANVGVLACAVAAQDPRTRVIAFEPHPRTFRLLERNVRLNGFENVSLHNLGLGSEPSTLYMSDRRSDDMNFISDAGVPVRVATLDDLLADVERIDLLKIDVEGYELEVLRGGSRTIARTREVYFEAFEHQYARFGYGFADVRAFLEDRGFTIFEVDPAGWSTRPVPRGDVPHQCRNMLARRPPSV